MVAAELHITLSLLCNLLYTFLYYYVPHTLILNVSFKCRARIESQPTHSHCTYTDISSATAPPLYCCSDHGLHCRYTMHGEAMTIVVWCGGLLFQCNFVIPLWRDSYKVEGMPVWISGSNSSTGASEAT